jgi:hypothetical protein
VVEEADGFAYGDSGPPTGIGTSVGNGRQIAFGSRGFAMVSLFVSVVIHPVEGDSPIPYDGPGGTLLDDTVSVAVSMDKFKGADSIEISSNTNLPCLAEKTLPGVSVSPDCPCWAPTRQAWKDNDDAAVLDRRSCHGI